VVLDSPGASTRPQMRGEMPEEGCLLALVTLYQSERLGIDVPSGTDGDDFEDSRGPPIDDPHLSHPEAPQTCKVFLEGFAAFRLSEDLTQTGTDFSFEVRMQRSNHRPSFIGELQPSGSHWLGSIAE